MTHGIIETAGRRSGRGAVTGGEQTIEGGVVGIRREIDRSGEVTEAMVFYPVMALVAGSRILLGNIRMGMLHPVITTSVPGIMGDPHGMNMTIAVTVYVVREGGPHVIGAMTVLTRQITGNHVIIQDPRISLRHITMG